MSNMQALNNNAHRTLLVDKKMIESIGSAERMVPVVLSEFLKLAVQYPIVFTKNEESGRFLCVALLGFDDKENLFWHRGQWDGVYTPLNIMRQPFFVGVDSANDGQVALCIDLDSSCISQHNGERVFDDEGRDTEYLAQVKSMLAELLEGEEKTQGFIQALLQHDLLTPLTLDITLKNGETRKVQGLYSIDEAKLDALDDEVVLSLRRQGFLKSLYVMIASLSQIYSLIQRKNASL